MEDRPKTPPRSPTTSGCKWMGVVCVAAAKLPVKIPAEPKPAMALPQMNVMEFGAVAQIKDPTSNTKMAETSTHLTGK